MGSRIQGVVATENLPELCRRLLHEVFGVTVEDLPEESVAIHEKHAEIVLVNGRHAQPRDFQPLNGDPAMHVGGFDPGQLGGYFTLQPLAGTELRFTRDDGGAQWQVVMEFQSTEPHYGGTKPTKRVLTADEKGAQIALCKTLLDLLSDVEPLEIDEHFVSALTP